MRWVERGWRRCRRMECGWWRWPGRDGAATREVTVCGDPECGDAECEGARRGPIGQGLISWLGPCPLEVPGRPKCGQGPRHRIRPCPSETRGRPFCGNGAGPAPRPSTPAPRHPGPAPRPTNAPTPALAPTLARAPGSTPFAGAGALVDWLSILPRREIVRGRVRIRRPGCGGGSFWGSFRRVGG